MYRFFTALLASSLCATSLAAQAAGVAQRRNVVREYEVALPDTRDKIAFPEARCMWEANYDAMISFVSKLERGVRAKEIFPLVDEMSRACGWKQRPARGDIVAAVVHLRDAEVDRCLTKLGGRHYRKFRKTIDTRKRQSPAVQRFLREGFPAELTSAIERCDRSLSPKFAEEDRGAFWKRVFVEGIGRE